MEVEGILLTGGASRRMGQDKARLSIRGELLSERIARALSSPCSRVVVLGREPIEGYDFVADEEEFAGPFAALSRFAPSAEAVFVVSCDLPRFDGRLVPFLAERLGKDDAVLPFYDGQVQPLCALYRARCWNEIGGILAEGKRSMMAWMDRLSCRTVTEEQIAAAGIDPRSFRGANTPEEWDLLLAD